jgi:hypothetical protein
VRSRRGDRARGRARGRARARRGPRAGRRGRGCAPIPRRSRRVAGSRIAARRRTASAPWCAALEEHRLVEDEVLAEARQSREPDRREIVERAAEVVRFREDGDRARTARQVRLGEREGYREPCTRRSVRPTASGASSPR